MLVDISSSMHPFNVFFQCFLDVVLGIAKVASVNCVGFAVFFLVVLFKRAGTYKGSVAKLAKGPLGVVPDNMLTQSLFSVKPLSAFIASVGWLNIRMFCPVVFMNIVYVTF